ncbi:MAG: hypothetical protein IIV10_03855 [Alistipes sp.]|nr:hypothetical protein [Alistipes sp.]
MHERFSTHCNGLSAFPVQTYSTEEILYALGLLGRKVIDTRSGDLCYKLDLVSKGYKHLLNHFDYTYDDAMAIAAGDDRESLVGKTVILNSGKIRYIRSIVAEVVTTGDVKYEYYQL